MCFTMHELFSNVSWFEVKNLSSFWTCRNIMNYSKVVKIISLLLILCVLCDVGYAPKGQRLCEHTKNMIIKHIQFGKEVRDIAHWFGLPVTTILAYRRKFRKHKTLKYKARSGGKKTKWTQTHTTIVIKIINFQSSIHLRELRIHLYKYTGDLFSISAIWKNLHKNRITNKVLTRRFSEANPNVELAFWYILTVNNVNINSIIWLDESYICRNSGNRRRGWSLRF